MAVQKIYYQQIANSGGSPGQVLIANSTGVTWGDANNAAFLGGTIASSYVTGTPWTSQGYLTAISGSGNTAYDSSRLGGTAAASFVQNTDSRTLSGNINFTGANSYFSGKATFNANLVINPSISVIDSLGNQGTAGQVLTSNGAGNVYWSSVSGGGGLAATNQIAWTNTQSFSNTITFSGPLVIANTIAANGTTNVGSAGYVLTSGGTGANVYWAAAASGGGGSFSNGASIAVSNLAYWNTASTAAAYTYYNTSTTSLDTVFI
jgi:hypothetical protein